VLTGQRTWITVEQRSVTVVSSDNIAELLAIGAEVDVRGAIDNTRHSEGHIRVPRYARLRYLVSIFELKSGRTCT
jgi:hypothetical protein